MTTARMYSKWYSELYRFAIARLAETYLAQDCVQQAFVRALENDETLETLSESQCRAWMYTTLRRIMADTYKKREIVEESFEEEAYDQDFSSHLVVSMLGRLDRDEAQLIAMRYLGSLNSTEIGSQLGLKPATVRTRLRAACARLKKIMDEEGE